VLYCFEDFVTEGTDWVQRLNRRQKEEEEQKRDELIEHLIIILQKAIVTVISWFCLKNSRYLINKKFGIFL